MCSNHALLAFRRCPILVGCSNCQHWWLVVLWHSGAPQVSVPGCFVHWYTQVPRTTSGSLWPINKHWRLVGQPNEPRSRSSKVKIECEILFPWWNVTLRNNSRVRRDEEAENQNKLKASCAVKSELATLRTSPGPESSKEEKPWNTRELPLNVVLLRAHHILAKL